MTHWQNWAVTLGIAIVMLAAALGLGSGVGLISAAAYKRGVGQQIPARVDTVVITLVMKIPPDSLMCQQWDWLR